MTAEYGGNYLKSLNLLAYGGLGGNLLQLIKIGGRVVLTRHIW
jgi:hypothetical protein